MLGHDPFILLDDARTENPGDARLFENPRALFIARRPEDVPGILQQAEQAQQENGGILAGYLSYEAGLALEGRLETLAAPRCGSKGPLVWFGLFDNETRIASYAVPQWLADHGSAGAADRPATLGPLDPQISTGAYCAAFDRLQQAIRAGDIYQANLTFPLAGAAEGDPLEIYARIRAEAAAGHGGIIFDGSHWLLSFSPELFFELKGDRVECRPMKGTRPRGTTPERDAELARELAASAKDKAENLMIVDLMRNDLSRVARPGSVQVDAPFTIETYPTVHTMVSTINAVMQPQKGAMDVIRALFPCGSITGAPKIRAMELIDEVERDARGPYCGSIGAIDAAGNASFNVAIRTLRLTPGENQRHSAELGVGGAIVADSDAMDEWRECLVKGGFTRKTAGGFDLIETMGFHPENGIPELELHLGRIKASAAELGFHFDRHEARNRIQAVCFELEQPARLRLLLARSGAITLDAGPMPARPMAEPVQCIALPHPTVAGDWRLRHKTTDRHFYNDALSVARENGAVEAVLVREDGRVSEGCYTNIFVERGGMLYTPRLSLGLLPGILRQSLIDGGKAEEADIMLDELGDGFWIGNALRGLMRATL
ncbi:aminodeoxychorismate synthase component I [Altericroceibacterium endophyticum]|uniref:Probable branched-chain-amino-acid aminotransferase n=1 Tax=Altericroceibacterium endophyticum TaxID=1808508 RepID=A0A6I4T5Z4_9SPHN|nr:aminodeoxychorismate synthase component I [Altericroceibacterium endophyticum]MXO65839.1 aminodeoxychorismate synthase component I [Altericroceibacterium endophyticum]